MHQSKFLKTVTLALFLLWNTVNAQDPRKGNEQPAKVTGEIPTMQEWWRADGFDVGIYQGISYLPNFKNGHDAVAVKMANGEIHTLLNRFLGDTENIFTWESNTFDSYNRISYGDFNGDGIRDYITSGGFLYQGVQNGQPPESTPVKKYILEGFHKVFDFNDDGFDDLYENGTTILYGGNDLANLVKSFGGQSTGDSIGTLGEIYKTVQGEFQFIVQNTKAKVYDGYDLYRATWKKGGIKPIFEKLDSIRQQLYPIIMQDFLYINGGQRLYQSKKNGKPFLITTESIDGSYNNTNVIIFEIKDNKFILSQRFQSNSSSPIILEHSIDGDEYEDWCLRRSQTECWFFSGGEKFDSIPCMKSTNLQAGSVMSIGDVSGDGINDVAIGYNTVGIVKGIDLTTSVEDNIHQSNIFTLREPVPQPIKNHQPSSVTASISQSGEYILFLYSIEGKQIGEVFKGQLETGEHKIPLNLAPYNFSPGSYILRLSNGTKSVERTIIITN